MLSNLSHAFPKWDKQKLFATAQESASRMFEMGFFSLIYPFMDIEQRKRTVVYDNQTLTLIQDLNDQDTPVLFLLPHLCLFESLATSPLFRPSKPKKMGAIYRPNRKLTLDKWIREARQKTGIEVFSRKAGLKESLYFLRKKNWLTILFDQNGGENGTDLLFLDRVSSITPLPDIFTKIENIRVVYACPKRIKMFQTELFLKEINLNEEVSVCQKAHELLAQDIKKCAKGFPEWLWAHGKWKVHYYPKVRFNLSSRRSFLEPNNIPRSGSRIVIRLPNWLGDVVMSLPIIRAIRKARPDMYFIILGRSIFKDFIDSLNLCEQYFEIDWRNKTSAFKILFQIRNTYPECQLLFTNSLRGDIESLLIGATFRFGLVLSSKKRPILTDSFRVNEMEFNSRHLTKTWEQMIQNFGFLGKVSYQPLFVNHSPEKNKSRIKVGIALGSSNNPKKRWPASHYIELIKLIFKYQNDVNISLFGTKSELFTSSEILNETCKLAVENLVGRTSISQLAVEFAGCSLIIGCDSGAVHLANAVGTSTLTIFGPTNHVVTAPCFDGLKIDLVPGDTEHSMKDWSPSDVFKQYEKLVEIININSGIV